MDLFQTIQFSVSTVKISTVLFQAIQFSVSMQFRYHKPIDKTLSSVTILGHSRPGSYGNEGVLCILQMLEP